MDRPIAWLFSIDHLSEAELREAGTRIRAGEVPDPSEKLIQMAREEIQRRTVVKNTDQRVNAAGLVGIGALSILLTPLAGLAFWWGYRHERPTAAAQILSITWPIGIGFSLLWSGVIVTRLLG